MLGNKVLLHIARRVNLSSKEGTLFCDLALIAEEEAQDGREHARRGERSNLEQRNTPIREDIRNSWNGQGRALHGEPYEICRCPRQAERYQWAHPAWNAYERPECNDGSKREQAVEQQGHWANHHRVEGGEPIGPVDAEYHVDQGRKVHKRRKNDQNPEDRRRAALCQPEESKILRKREQDVAHEDNEQAHGKWIDEVGGSGKLVHTQRRQRKA